LEIDDWDGNRHAVERVTGQPALRQSALDTRQLAVVDRRWVANRQSPIVNSIDNRRSSIQSAICNLQSAIIVVCCPSCGSVRLTDDL
jgi:hypothetical protein